MTVSRDDLCAEFGALGLSPGDAVFVHSSLRSFGHVEGGARAVVGALLDVLGPGGTLAVPIFARYFTEGPQQIWNRHRTPSLMGRITETVRTWPGAYRSAHPIHPVAAVGAKARDIADRDHALDFDADSPFRRLIDHDAWIALLGVTYQNCTHIHVVEERLEVPYRRWVERSGTVVDGDARTFRVCRFLERWPGVRNDFMPLGNALEGAGLVTTRRIGLSTVRLFRARRLVALGLERVRRDPLFLVSADTKAGAARHVL